MIQVKYLNYRYIICLTTVPCSLEEQQHPESLPLNGLNTMALYLTGYTTIPLSAANCFSYLKLSVCNPSLSPAVSQMYVDSLNLRCTVEWKRNLVAHGNAREEK